MEMLPNTHKMKADIIARIKELMGYLGCIRDVAGSGISLESEYIRKCKMDGIDMATGCVSVFS